MCLLNQVILPVDTKSLHSIFNLEIFSVKNNPVFVIIIAIFIQEINKRSAKIGFSDYIETMSFDNVY